MPSIDDPDIDPNINDIDDLSDCVWWTGPVECSICGCKAVAVVPVDPSLSEPIVPLECGECRNFTLEIV